jgi:protoheme IX farnesyltransferase
MARAAFSGPRGYTSYGRSGRLFVVNMTRFQKLCLATAGTTVLLFAVGGLVRGSGSGLGCDTWPNCTPTSLFPSGTVHSLIEFSHRLLVFVDTVLIAITGIVAWRGYRSVRKVFFPAVAAFPLVIAQAVLGGIVVKTDLDPAWVTAHFTVALLLVADVVYLAANSFCTVKLPEKEGPIAGSNPKFARLTLITALVTGGLLLVGTYVRARGAGLAFDDWPLMNGKLVPTLGGIATPMFAHRVLAAAGFLLVLYTTVRAWTMRPRSKDLVVLSTTALGLFLAEIMVGAANVWSRLKPAAVVAHVALAVLIWATLVALATVSRRFAEHRPRTEAPETEPTDDAAVATRPKPSLRARTTAYVQLTKPRIVLLLLITTVPTMVLAAGRFPSIWLVLSVLFGGTLAAGGANAMNQFFDRDIDELMRRTRSRPLPAHRIPPESALGFGYLLGVISFFWLATMVNVISAELALSALLFYVIVYTLMLKRTTTQNIVIGGAAGAVPVLVGWAAVTGGLSLAPWILFAIVFFWTPPHFWALAMRYTKDYAAAKVPMLPVVKGERRTTRSILLYTVVLFGITLLLFPVARMGAIYLVTAVGLGIAFVAKAVQLWRRRTPAMAIGLFKFSITYLGLLFAAVMIDALLPIARG